MSRMATVLCCLIYVVSPIDLLPELVLGPLGLMDDAVVVLIGLRRLLREG